MRFRDSALTRSLLAWASLYLLAAAAASQQPEAPTTAVPDDRSTPSASLIVETDSQCKLSLDGEPLGVLASGSTRTFEIPPGEHVLEAVSIDEPAIRSREVLTATDGTALEISILLRKQVMRTRATTRCRDRPEDCFLEIGSEILLDPRHDMAWSRRSMGSDRNWTEAQTICRELSLGGYTDWRLPTIGELESLTRRDLERTPCGAARCQAFPQFDLQRPWIWSSTRGENEAAWHLLFDLGLRHSVPTALEEQTGTLCVRRSDG